MNEVLHDYVTRVDFAMTLTRTQIAAMVEVQELWATDRLDDDGMQGNALRHPLTRSHFITGVQGCERRGLIWHVTPSFTRGKKDVPSSKVFGLTTAGHYMVGLLSEAGIWQKWHTLLHQRLAIAMEAAR